MEQKAQKLMLGTVGVAGLFLAGGTSVSANTTHKVNAHETVWDLSQKYGVSIQSIEELNHIDTNSHLIFTGQTLKISGESHENVVKKATKTQTPTATSTYEVKAGDSLWSIAQEYQTSVDHLRSLNDLSAGVIFPGQTLKVDGAAVHVAKPATTVAKTTTTPVTPAQPATATTPAKGSTPSVQPAQAPQTPAAQPAEETPTTPAPKQQDAQPATQTAEKQAPVKEEVAQPEKVQQVAVKKAQPQISANHKTHTVTAGESLYTIAQDFGVSVDSLRTANALESSALQVGQNLTVNDPTKDPTAQPAPQVAKPATPAPAKQQQQASTPAPSQPAKPTTPAPTPAPKPAVEKPAQTQTNVQNTNNNTPAPTPTPAPTVNHGNGYNPSGNTYDWGQCTWFAKDRASWAGNYWGNGGNWDASARAQGFAVDNHPTAGSLVVFHPGQSVGGQWTADGYAGHVAYVESVSGNTITISQGGMGFSNPGGPNYQTISNAGQYTYIHH